MKNVRFTLVLLIIFSAAISSAQEIRQGLSIERLERYDTYINDMISEGRIPGASLLVARNGEIVYKKAFGESDLSSGRDMETDDIFYIQSMTKPIITTALMMLYEEGHFQLNDPLHLYLPEAKDLKVMINPQAGKSSPVAELTSPITIEQLLTHTAGFSHGLGSSEYEQELRKALFFTRHERIQDRVEALMTFPLIGQPGEQWQYSAAPDILSVLIEKFSGKSTSEFLRERIFEPLGMDNTFYNVPSDKSTRIVMNHQIDENGKLVPAESQPPSTGVTVWSGVNGLFSTTEDYFKFCQMLLNGGFYNGKYLLSRKTVEIMTINQTGDLFPGPGTGFGLGFGVVNDLASTGNSGSEGIYYWSGAFNTHFFIDPKEKLIAMFFTQLQPHEIFFHDKLRQMIYQALVR